MPKKYITKKQDLLELEWNSALRVDNRKGNGLVYIPRVVIDGLKWEKGEELVIHIFDPGSSTHDRRKLVVASKNPKKLLVVDNIEEK